MRKFEKESKTNKRLSMDYEELMWRMSQSSDFGGSQENLARRQLSHSPPGSESSSPDVSRKFRSPAGSDMEGSPSRIPGVVYRRPASTGEPPSSRRLKHRSATYIVDGNSHSPSRSPIPSRGSPGLDMSSSPTRNGDSGRMARSLNDADVFGIPQGLPSPVEPPGLRSMSDSSDALIGVRIDREISVEAPEDGKTAEGPSTLSDISESLQDHSESMSNEYGLEALSQDGTGSSHNISSSSDNSDGCNSPVKDNASRSTAEDICLQKKSSADNKGNNSNKIDCRSVDKICDRDDEMLDSEFIVGEASSALSVDDASDVSKSQSQNCGMATEPKGVIDSASCNQSHVSISCDTNDSLHQSDRELCLIPSSQLLTDSGSCDRNAYNLDSGSNSEMSAVCHLFPGETRELCLESSSVGEDASGSVEEGDNSVSSDLVSDPQTFDTVDVNDCIELDESVEMHAESTYNPTEVCNISSDQEYDLAEDSRTKSILDSHSLVCSTDDTSDSITMDTGMDEIFTLDMDLNSETDTDPNGSNELERDLLSSQPHGCKSSVEPTKETLIQGPSHPVKKSYKESTV